MNGRGHMGRAWHRWKDNFEMNRKGMGYQNEHLMKLVQLSNQKHAVVTTVMNLWGL
jgi:hypothetical protein